MFSICTSVLNVFRLNNVSGTNNTYLQHELKTTPEINFGEIGMLWVLTRMRMIFPKTNPHKVPNLLF